MPLIITHCQICGERDSRLDWSATRYLNLAPPFEVLRCLDCGFRWLSPRPTTEEYAELYDAEYFGNIENQGLKRGLFKDYPPPDTNYTEIEVPARKAWHKARLRRIAEVTPKGKTLLDVGAATGSFLAIARDMGFDVSGIEYSLDACDAARRTHSLNLHCGSLEDFDSHGSRFDVVHLSHVFEHLVDPVCALRRISALMHRNSLLVMEVPNQFDAPISWIFRQFLRKQRPRDLFSVHHPVFYSPNTLKWLLVANGFRIVSTKSFFSERYGFAPRSIAYAILDLAGEMLGRGGNNLEVMCQHEGQ